MALLRILLIIVLLVVVLLLILGLPLRIAVLVVAEAAVQVLVWPVALGRTLRAPAARGLRASHSVPPAASGIASVHL